MNVPNPLVMAGYPVLGLLCARILWLTWIEEWDARIQRHNEKIEEHNRDRHPHYHKNVKIPPRAYLLLIVGLWPIAMSAMGLYCLAMALGKVLLQITEWLASPGPETRRAIEAEKNAELARQAKLAAKEHDLPIPDDTGMQVKP